MLVVITGRNEVVAKVMFLHMCVILFTGGCLQAGRTPWPGRENPPGQTGRTPPWARQGEPPRLGCRLQYTVYERPVRILLECILVCL